MKTQINKDQARTIYVTVGHPNGDFPIQNKVAILYFSDITTPTKTAKKFRKQIADNIEGYGYVKGTKMKPSELYWEVYLSALDKDPVLKSKNANIQKIKEWLHKNENKSINT